jgi:hypothetical protein
MAMGMGSSDGHRHNWMVDRDGLGRHRNRSMASGLIELETLDCYRSRAKHHSP